MERNIAIIGIGPRGGFAFEKLVEKLNCEKGFKNIHIALFEQTQNYGNGQVYNLKQNSSNWINITERITDLPKRKAFRLDSLSINEFPSYKQWAFKDKDFDETNPDTYPPRSKMGKYLSQRFNSLVQPLINEGLATIINEKVEYLEWLPSGKLLLKTSENEYKGFDEALLTIGHQPTSDDKQIKQWEQYVSKNTHVHLFKEAYPIKKYLHHKALTINSTIAIRGFGLAMIDITRAIALNFGNFIYTDIETRGCKFDSTQLTQNLIVPFSLDGLPPVPKPLNANIDKLFKPTQQSLSDFEEKIANHQTQQSANSPDFLLNAFAPIAKEIFNNLPFKNLEGVTENIEEVIKLWLKAPSYTHSLITANNQSPLSTMEEFVGMATGKTPISLDYCVGQVWRYCQPTIYSALSHNKCDEKVFGEIIQIDESTKRYSFGPPVESIQQMIALIKVGFLNIDFANNPSISLTKKGWELSSNKKQITASIMIDSMIDSPKVKAVTAPLVSKLLADNIMEPVHSEFGIVTDEYGYLVSENIDNKIPIALLGRLAKGTVIGVDAILECFGKRPEMWAEKASKNHLNWLKKNYD
ncbi:FAD/NAD(P)-binding protein [Ascidiimonas aurantiaca]|uniref:FAD/NAD(P)-binding protein n=1 Tax=Ascidiimonas aurantiaca TaxID=1685432 RepID=UPI0030ED0ECC